MLWLSSDQQASPLWTCAGGESAEGHAWSALFLGAHCVRLLHEPLRHTGGCRAACRSISVRSTQVSAASLKQACSRIVVSVLR